MIVWFFFTCVALLLGLLSQKDSSLQFYKAARVLLVIWLAWFVSFGGKGMTDQVYYEIIYQSFDKESLLDFSSVVQKHINALSGSRNSTEIGFQVFGTVFNLLGFSFVGFAFFYGILLNALMVNFIYRHKSPVLILLIFIATVFYSQQANLMRQMMAVAFFLYATKFIISNKIGHYVLFVFLGSFFHASVLFLLPIYFLLGRRIPQMILISVWLSSVLLFFVGESIPIVQTIRSIEVAYYDVNLDKDEGVGVDTGFHWLFNIILGLVIIFRNTKGDKKGAQNLLINLFFIGVIILNLRVVSDWFFRMSIYFTISYIAVIPYFLEDMRYKLKGLVSYSLLKLLYLIPVFYYIYIILSYVFRELDGHRIGTEMYGFYDLWQ